MTFLDILKFAREYARQEKVSSEVIVFRWTGKNTDEARMQAGLKLSRIMDALVGKTIITFSHSHGSNVVNHASQKVKTPIDLMIQLGTPVREDLEYRYVKIYKPEKFRTLISFWAMVDWVSFFGVLEAVKESWSNACALFRAGKEKLLGPFPVAEDRPLSVHKYKAQTGKTVKNILVHFDGNPQRDWQEWYCRILGHSYIRDTIYYLLEILNKTRQMYPVHNDLMIDIPIRALAELLLAIQRGSLNPAMNNTLEALRSTRWAQDHTSQELDAQIKKEQETSYQQKRIFRERYNKPMDIN